VSNLPVPVFPPLHPRTDVTTHGTFVLERTFAAGRSAVFAAWSSAEAKRQWFQPPEGWVTTPHEFDFRVGGAERHTSTAPDGVRHGYQGRYFDIVPNARLVFGYAMDLDGDPLSVSLVTIEVSDAAGGTRMVFTEQGAYFLDGGAELVGGREWGSRLLLDSLERYLAG